MWRLRLTQDIIDYGNETNPDHSPVFNNYCNKVNSSYILFQDAYNSLPNKNGDCTVSLEGTTGGVWDIRNDCMSPRWLLQLKGIDCRFWKTFPDFSWSLIRNSRVETELIYNLGNFRFSPTGFFFIPF